MAYPMPAPRQLTLEEYESLPEDDLYRDELSRGYLIREPQPGSQHGLLVTRVAYELMLYVQAHPECGRVYSSAGFLLRQNPPTVRGPDVAFVRAERIPPRGTPGFFRGAPDLAIEILSPSNRPGEVLHKVSEFLDAGTELVWVLDPKTRCVVVHRQTVLPEVLTADEQLEGGELMPGLVLNVASLFADD